MSLLKRKTVLAAKIETTAYTAISLAAADATFQAYDAIIQPTVNMVERPQQGSFVNNADAVGTQMGTCTFRLDFNGDGAAGPAAWAQTFLPACGWVESSGLFSPQSEAPGSNVKTLTISTYVDGIVKTIKGAMGSFVLTLEAGMPSFIDFTFQGALVATSDTALLSPTYTTRAPIRYASSATTIGSMSPCIKTVTIDAGNNVIMRPCNDESTGYKGALITNRNTTVTMDPETALVASQTFEADWLAGTTRQIDITLSDDTDTVTITGQASPNNIQEGNRDNIVTDELTYKISQPNQLTIDFS